MSSTSNSADFLVVGGGPAGLTAALTLVRQMHSLVLFDSGKYRNGTARYQHMVPTWDHKSPVDFRAAARHELLNNYKTAHIENVDIVWASKTSEGFELKDEIGNTWTGKKLILALGSSDTYPDIPGYAECWANTIFHCLYCHGYEEQGSPSSGVLAVQGCADVPLAVHNAETAAQLSHQVTVYTNGNEDLARDLTAAFGQSTVFKVDSRPISSLVKSLRFDGGLTMHFSDGTEKTEAFLVHNPLTSVRGDLASQLGLQLSPMGDIAADPPFYQTSVRGVFAAGDCITTYKVTPGAISSGCNAAIGASRQFVAEKHGHTPLI